MKENKEGTAPIDETSGRPFDSTANFGGGLSEGILRAAMANKKVEIAEFVVSKADEISQLVKNNKQREAVRLAIEEMGVRIRGSNKDSSLKETTSIENSSDE